MQVQNNGNQQALWLKGSNRSSLGASSIAFAIGIASVLFVLLFRWTPLLESLELSAYDYLIKLRASDMPTGNPIAIVTLTENEISDTEFWDYPLPDDKLALLLERIASSGAAVVGMDIYRNIPVPKDGSKLHLLEEVLTKHPNIIAIKRVGAHTHDGIQAPKVLDNRRERVAFNDFPLDGVAADAIRRGILLMDEERDGKNSYYYSLSLLCTMHYLYPMGITPQPSPKDPYLMRLGKITIPRFQASDGPYINASAEGYQYFLDFRFSGKYPTYTVKEVMSPDFDTEKLKEKVVLFGVDAISVQDQSVTPLRYEHKGVEIHAQAIDQLLSMALDGLHPLRVWSDPVESGWIIFWGLFGALLGSFSMTPARFALALIAISALICCIFYYLFMFGTWVPVVAPLFSLLTGAAVATSYVSYCQRRERAALTSLFSKHVSKEVALALWEQRDTFMQKGKLPGKQYQSTILMTDIQGYSTISEQLGPEELFDWLNDYMEVMSKAVFRNRGIVNNYIGDAILAVFGVPIPRVDKQEQVRDAINATKCALEMKTDLATLNKDFEARNLPPVRMRIGISTGPIIAGSFGGADAMQYGIIGDTTNTASRLESFDKESITKDESCRVLVSESTWELLGNRFDGMLIGHVKLKGKEEMPKVYKVLGIKKYPSPAA